MVRSSEEEVVRELFYSSRRIAYLQRSSGRGTNKKTRLGVLGQPGGCFAAKIAVLCFAVCCSVLNMSGMMGAEFVLNNTKYRPKTPRVLLGGSFAVAPR